MPMSTGRSHAARAVLAFALAGGGAAACATLGGLAGLIQPPRLATVPDRPAELRLLGAGTGLPLGGAGVRLWARVENPNPFGLTLSTLTGSLHLEGSSSGDWAPPRPWTCPSVCLSRPASKRSSPSTSP